MRLQHLEPFGSEHSVFDRGQQTGRHARTHAHTHASTHAAEVRRRTSQAHAACTNNPQSQLRRRSRPKRPTKQSHALFRDATDGLVYVHHSVRQRVTELAAFNTRGQCHPGSRRHLHVWHTRRRVHERATYTIGSTPQEHHKSNETQSNPTMFPPHTMVHERTDAPTHTNTHTNTHTQRTCSGAVCQLKRYGDLFSATMDWPVPKVIAATPAAIVALIVSNLSATVLS